MKVMKALFLKETWMKGILGFAACLIVFCLTGVVAQAAEGTVKAETAKIRKEANTESEVIGSTVQGKVIDIVGGVKDASGTVWYKVPNGNNTYGYIRSDLVETSDEIKITEDSSTGSSDNSSSGNANKPAETVPTAIGEQQATVTESSIRVRSGASTQHDTVASLPHGTVITLIGEANDNSGNKWYQMTCNHNNKTVEGYVRSDLISIGAPVVNEEEPAEGSETAEGTEGAVEGENPVEGEGAVTDAEAENTEGGEAEQTPAEPAEPEHNDYEVVYNDGEYWLYINTEGTMMKVSEVLNVVDTANENHEKLTDQINSNKIIIVILAVIIVLLVIAVTVLIFKLRDLYYEDYYEDDDEDEEEEEPVAVRRTKRAATYEEETPIRKKRPVLQEEISAVSPKEEQVELQAAERKAPAKKPASRKAQNFLLDDDEFEFEFLNMDDKDL